MRTAALQLDDPRAQPAPADHATAPSRGLAGLSRLACHFLGVHRVEVALEDGDTRVVTELADVAATSPTLGILGDPPDSDGAPMPEGACIRVPLVTSGGREIGTLRAFGCARRTWGDAERSALQELAQAAVTELELHEQREGMRAASRIIAEQSERMREILDNTQQLVALVALDGSIQYGNEAWWSTLGMPPDAETAAWLRQRLDPASATRFDAARQRVLETEESDECEVVALSADHLPIDLALRLVPRYEAMHVTGVHVFGSDITERRRVERMKDQMVGIVSHELRTPIGAVQGALQLLTRLLPPSVGDKPRELLALASRNAQRLLALVNDLLDLERLETGQANIELQPVALDAAYAVAQDATAPLAERAGVTVHWDSGDAVVLADRDRLARVFINLVGNAIKFTPAGKEVRVDGTAEGAVWHLRVTDQGRGVPASERERIFERFSQVSRADATEKGGSGLGLTIARAIVQQHGGRIWVESEEGRGSVFHFTIPRLAG